MSGTDDYDRTLSALLPAVGRALEAAGPRDAGKHAEGWSAQPRATECLLLASDGSALHATAGAQRVALLALDGVTMATVGEPIERLLERGFGSLLQEARRRLATQSATAPPPTDATSTARLRASVKPLAEQRSNVYGRFVAVATPLWPVNAAGTGAAPMLQISLSWTEPQRAAYARALRKLPITARQFRVCDGLLRGLPQSSIAAELGEGPATVVDHVRKGYTALDVASSHELRSLVERCATTLH